MPVIAFKQEIEIEVFDCAACSLPFGITKEFEKRRRADHASFYCPSGHSQSFGEKTEAERLREMLTEANASKTALAASLQVARAEAEAARNAEARLRKRIRSGTCPCCKRTFKQLARHMATKHPDAKS